MTQKEIAKILNRSCLTVSLALAKYPKIKQETLKRVSEFARKTNYHPNMAARSLVLGKTNLISVSNGEKELSNLISSMMARKVDGIISCFEVLKNLLKFS